MENENIIELRMREAKLKELAALINTALNKIYGEKMAFFLCVSPIDDTKDTADYIGSATRETAIDWMKETVERFEKNQTIPAGGGSA